MKTEQIYKIEWREVQLEEITECLDGKRIPITESERKSGIIPYYGANGQVGWIDKPIFDEELLLVAEDGGSWGKGERCAYIIKGKSWVNNHAHVLRVKKDKANILFIMHWLNMENLNKYISGTTRGKLNQKAMNKIKILLPFSSGKPDLKEQERIVSILEKAEKQKERGKKSEEFLDEYLKSVFNEMFLKSNSQFVEIGKGILKTKNVNPERDFPDKCFSYIDIASIDNNEKRIIETKKVLGKEAPDRAKQLVKYNDTLVSTVRPNLNAVALVPKSLDNQICSTGFCILRTDNKTFIPEYLFFISKTVSFI